jgi:hypothetical protein
MKGVCRCFCKPPVRWKETTKNGRITLGIGTAVLSIRCVKTDRESSKFRRDGSLAGFRCTYAVKTVQALALDGTVPLSYPPLDECSLSASKDWSKSRRIRIVSYALSIISPFVFSTGTTDEWAWHPLPLECQALTPDRMRIFLFSFQRWSVGTSNLLLHWLRRPGVVTLWKSLPSD